jgi:hypothetical protein
VARVRESFIRPTYWEVPMRTSVSPKLPPDDLSRLHFYAFHEEPRCALRAHRYIAAMIGLAIVITLIVVITVITN